MLTRKQYIITVKDSKDETFDDLIKDKSFGINEDEAFFPQFIEGSKALGRPVTSDQIHEALPTIHPTVSYSNKVDLTDFIDENVMFTSLKYQQALAEYFGFVYESIFPDLSFMHLKEDHQIFEEVKKENSRKLFKFVVKKKLKDNLYEIIDTISINVDQPKTVEAAIEKITQITGGTTNFAFVDHNVIYLLKLDQKFALVRSLQTPYVSESFEDY